MRDRQRAAAQRRIARDRATLCSHGIVPISKPAKFERKAATAEQLAFREYISMGYDAETARSMVSADTTA